MLIVHRLDSKLGFKGLRVRIPKGGDETIINFLYKVLKIFYK